MSRSLVSDSGRVSLLIGLGIAAKLGLDLSIAARFGLGSVTDAFFIAYTVPLISEAILYQSSQLALVPLFVHEQRIDAGAGAWSLFNSLFSAAALISVGLVAIVLAAGQGLVARLAPGAEETHELTLSLARVLVLGVLPVGPIAVMKAFLNAHRLYSAPASLELLRGAVVIAALLVGYSSLGIGALALGFVLASALQFVLLAGAVVRGLGFGYRPRLDWALLRARGVGHAFSVPLVDYCLAQPVIVLERVLGSYLPAGSITAINYGRRIVSALTVALFGGLEAVALPHFASELGKGAAAAERARAALMQAARLSFVIGIPIALSAWALRESITQLVFQRGAFDHASTLVAAPVIGGFLLSLPFYGYSLLFRAYLFGSRRALVALALSCAGLSVNVALALSLWPFLGALGMAAAYLGGLLAFALGSWIVAERPLRSLQLAAARIVARVALASAATAAAQLVVFWASSDWLAGMEGLSSTAALVAALACAGAVGALLLLVLLTLFGVSEASDLWKRLWLRRVPG